MGMLMEGCSAVAGAGWLHRHQVLVLARVQHQASLVPEAAAHRACSDKNGGLYHVHVRRSIEFAKRDAIRFRPVSGSRTRFFHLLLVPLILKCELLASAFDVVGVDSGGARTEAGALPSVRS